MASINVFAGLMVLAFGLSLLLSGLFTAYFGAGKSRKIGLGLTLSGLVALAFFVSATWPVTPGVSLQAWAPDEIMTGVIGVAGAAVGTFIGLMAFLVSVMKA